MMTLGTLLFLIGTVLVFESEARGHSHQRPLHVYGIPQGSSSKPYAPFNWPSMTSPIFIPIPIYLSNSLDCDHTESKPQKPTWMSGPIVVDDTKKPLVIQESSDFSSVDIPKEDVISEIANIVVEEKQPVIVLPDTPDLSRHAKLPKLSDDSLKKELDCSRSETETLELPRHEKVVIIPEAPTLPSLLIHETPKLITDFSTGFHKNDILSHSIAPYLAENYVVELPTPSTFQQETKSEETFVVLPEETKTEMIPEAPTLAPYSPSTFQTINVSDFVNHDDSTLHIGEFSEYPIEDAHIEHHENEESRNTVVIPQAPVLPPLLLSEILPAPQIPISYIVDTPRLTALIPEAPEHSNVHNEAFEKNHEWSPEKSKENEDSKDKKESKKIIPSAPQLPVSSLLKNKKIYEITKDEKIVLIPEAPKLSPLLLPEIPIYIETDKHSQFLAPYPAANYVAELTSPLTLEQRNESEKTITVVPAEPKITVIPEAPTLLPFSPPKFQALNIDDKSTVHDVDSTSQVGEFSGQLLGGAAHNEEAKTVILIPEAPVLPPLSHPEIVLQAPYPPMTYIINSPKLTSPIPETPILQPEHLNDANESFEKNQEWTLEKLSENDGGKKIIIIPEAPVLPPFFLSDNEIKQASDQNIQPTPSHTIEEIKTNYIPEAPELPPLRSPSLPIVISRPVKEPWPHAPEAPELPLYVSNVISEEKSSPKEKLDAIETIVIPPAPKLPSFVIPEVPTIILEKDIPFEESISTPVLISNKPRAPELPHQTIEQYSSFVPKIEGISNLPTAKFCIYTILNERVLPNIMESPKAEKLIQIPEAPVLPPFKPFIPITASTYIPGPPAETYGLPV